jgi:hypothetical protein
VSAELYLQCIDQRLDAHRIKLRDRFIHHHGREMRRLRVRDCVLTFGVEEDFVEAAENAVRLQESAALAFDCLFEKGGSGGASWRFS